MANQRGLPCSLPVMFFSSSSGPFSSSHLGYPYRMHTLPTTMLAMLSATIMAQRECTGFEEETSACLSPVFGCNVTRPPHNPLHKTGFYNQAVVLDLHRHI